MDHDHTQTMWRDQLAQWKAGDFFVFRTEVNLPEIRCYRGVPIIGGQERYIHMPNVNLNHIFIVTAVYEEQTFTAVQFHNMDARIPLQDLGMPHHGIGPAESYWTVVRHNNQLLCRHMEQCRSGTRSRNRSW